MALTAASSTAICQQVTKRPDLSLQAEPLPFPKAGPDQSPAALSIDQIEARIHAFENIIGKYPPKFDDWSEHEATYHEWAQVLLAAKNMKVDKENSERIACALAALYRQGHNMDVADCGVMAIDLLHEALNKHPDSIPLNWQAAFLFLQISPKYAPEGEKALLKLRKLLNTDKNLEVERGLVFAYLNENRIPEAKAQIDRCLAISPGDAMLLKFKTGLEDGSIGVQSSEPGQ